MLWSNPQILYDTLVDYRIEPGATWFKSWKLKRTIAGMSTMRHKNVLCVTQLPKAPKTVSVLWQHAFLAPFLKDMQTGWHLCLLPRHMVVVIQDGRYICERQVENMSSVIESTQKYMYRFGYEPDIAVKIHDLKNHPEKISVLPGYSGFVFHPNHSFHQRLRNFMQGLSRLIQPHIDILLIATTLSLGVGTFYYILHNYNNDWERIRLLQLWPTLQTKKTNTQKMLDVLGLLDEANVPKDFVQSIKLDARFCIIHGNPQFDPKTYRDAFALLFKKYSIHKVTAESAKTSVTLQLKL